MKTFIVDNDIAATAIYKNDEFVHKWTLDTFFSLKFMYIMLCYDAGDIFPSNSMVN